MLGIIGAMDVEVKKLREMMEDPEIQTVAGMTFYQGTIKGKAVVVVRSGIGKVNAGLCSQILVDRYHVSGIINTGIAGSLRNEVNVGISSWPRMRSSTIWMPQALGISRERSRRWGSRSFRQMPI